MIDLSAITVLLSHWRKHPFQLIMLLTGLFLASALWTGVEAINTEARASYALAEAALSPPRFASIVSAKTRTIPVDTYTRLQTSGWRTSPIFEKRVRLGDRYIRAIGVDALTYPTRDIFEDAASQDSAQDFI
ncbi:MAG: ABC transporter permease, partial [Methyloceanibacter sp.]